MTHSYVGSCQCGYVRVECTAAPVMHLYCHCNDYRQATAPAFNIIFMISLFSLVAASR